MVSNSKYNHHIDKKRNLEIKLMKFIQRAKKLGQNMSFFRNKINNILYP